MGKFRQIWSHWKQDKSFLEKKSIRILKVISQVFTSFLHHKFRIPTNGALTTSGLTTFLPKRSQYFEHFIKMRHPFAVSNLCNLYYSYVFYITLHYLHYCYVLEHTNMLMLYNPMLLTNNMVYLGQCPCYKILIEHLHNIVLLLWFTRVHIYFGVYKPWCSWIKYHSTSVSRWLYYFFKIWPFTTMKNCLKYKIFAKIGSQFCKIQNGNSRNGQKRFKCLPKWRNFAKSGHTAFNLICSFLLRSQNMFSVYFCSLFYRIINVKLELES